MMTGLISIAALVGLGVGFTIGVGVGVGIVTIMWLKADDVSRKDGD